ncbi:SMI1/KNR4 family protein (plasmid) [Agrobacterium sp. rho-13.3]|uniref:SMI1/KNR4 family protein n=1 Tax=Agrobacterium sp. rho-13.3 TaxID=3072980 RepID=UPI002A118AF5|nr:SMI1/KNR4 family protein [Agrobacterium sp. rho-13.3]MDX8310214.1 SMI1/KNR4 family protein [Agrobacterium sp. rho-13.3]
MHLISEFEDLSTETGIALPPLLRSLIFSGNTNYFPGWYSLWRDRSLDRVVPFLSWYDYEWIDAATSRNEIATWLNPAAQHGKAFLPFAQSGAGDIYCLMTLEDGQTGVALIWQYNESSQIDYRSFNDFVCIRYLETFADLSHLSDDFPDEISEIISADVYSVSRFMDEQKSGFLRGFCQRRISPHEVRYGKNGHTQTVPALISQSELDFHTAQFPAPSPKPFPVVPRWELSQFAPINTKTAVGSDWRSKALDPNTKLQAIRAYQQTFQCTLIVAKKAVDEFIIDAGNQASD